MGFPFFGGGPSTSTPPPKKKYPNERADTGNSTRIPNRGAFVSVPGFLRPCTRVIY